MKRSLLIDVLKGCAIIFVVLGHSIQYGYGIDYLEKESFYDNYIFRAIYTFHMPLFMLISGYLFGFSNRKKYIHVLYSKIWYVGIPYLFYFSLLYFLWWFTSQLDVFYITDYLMKLFGQVWLWYLSSLLLNCFLISTITHLFRYSVGLGISALMVSCSFFIPNTIIPDTHKYMYTFFSIGYYCRTIAPWLLEYVKKLNHLFISAIVFLLSIFVYGKELMIYEGGYCIVENGHICLIQIITDIVRYIIGSVTICFFIGFVANYITRVRTLSKILCMLGQQSLAIYCLQSVFWDYFPKIINITYFISGFMIVLWPLFLCCIILILCEFIIFCLKWNTVTRLLFLGKK